MPTDKRYKGSGGRALIVRPYQLKNPFDERTTQEQQQEFLAYFVDTCSIGISCNEAKIPITRFNDWRHKDILFKEKFAEAVDIVTTRLEDEAVRRAYDGVLEPIFQGGKKVGVKRVYSDTLLAKLLEAYAPDKYRSKQDNRNPNQSTILVLPTNGREILDHPVSNSTPNAGDYIQPEEMEQSEGDAPIVDFPNKDSAEAEKPE